MIRSKIWAYVLLACGVAGVARAQEDAPEPVAEPGHKTIRYVQREFLLPTPTSGRGMDVLEVRVDGPEKRPLAILTHGTSDKPEERALVTPWAQLGQAMWFARRGYVALVVVRDGYGRSGGVPDTHDGGCGPQGSFVTSGEASAKQLKEAIDYMVKQPEVDASQIVSAGVSTGGFAQVALTADPPPGLKAAISFAGGRGGNGKGDNCNLGGIVSAFKSFGKKSRTPMLWLYAENDKWFPPAMAAQFEKAFHDSGGEDQFVMVPPDGEDGHGYYRHVSAWSDRVDAYLKAHNLLPLAEPLPPPPLPKVPAPAGLGDRGLQAFQNFLAGGYFRAFATNGNTAYGYATGMFDQALADKTAIENCQKNLKGGGSCKVQSRGAMP